MGASQRRKTDIPSLGDQPVLTILAMLRKERVMAKRNG